MVRPRLKVARNYGRYTRRQGQLVPLKRPDAAGNAQPHKVMIVHGGNSRALARGALDRRSAVGKAYVTLLREYRNYVGRNPSLLQQRLIEQAARMGLVTGIAWAELNRSGLFKNGETVSAFEAFLKASRDEREILRVLGVQPQDHVIDVAAEIARQNREEEKQ